VKTVVFAEDDRHIALLIEFALADRGFQVEHYGGGAELLERLGRAPRPDAIVLDLMLPGIDGFGVLERMRASPALAAVPVLVLSARARDVDRAAALERGARAYLTKPFDVDELAALVLELTGPPEETRP